MRKLAIAAFGILTAAGLTVASTDDAIAKKKAGACVMSTGKGTGLTPDLARNFAADALLDGQAQRKLKGQGKITYKCSNASGLNDCAASQRSCAAK